MDVGRRWLRALWVLPVAAASSGCFVLGSQDCSDEPAYCDGSAIVRCVPPCSDIGCSRTWEREECPATCVNPQGGPLCALSQTADPRCQGVDVYCDAAQVVRCALGYALSKEACPATTSCAMTDGGRPVCAVGGAPDVRCPATDDVTSHCEGKTAISCASGFATAVTDCANACAPLWGVAGCALSNAPDPRCAVEVTHSNDFSYCDGPTLVTCNNGFQVDRKNCSCVDHDGFPVCEATDAGG
jgi:hypothetical protein